MAAEKHWDLFNDGRLHYWFCCMDVQNRKRQEYCIAIYCREGGTTVNNFLNAIERLFQSKF